MLAETGAGVRHAEPGIHTLSGTMCQHDFDGNRVFQHRNGRKWSMYENPQVPGFDFEAECVRFIDELKVRLVARGPDAADGRGPCGDRGDGWSAVRVPPRGLRPQADGVSGRRDVRRGRGRL